MIKGVKFLCAAPQQQRAQTKYLKKKKKLLVNFCIKIKFHKTQNKHCKNFYAFKQNY